MGRGDVAYLSPLVIPIPYTPKETSLMRKKKGKLSIFHKGKEILSGLDAEDIKIVFTEGITPFRHVFSCRPTKKGVQFPKLGKWIVERRK